MRLARFALLVCYPLRGRRKAWGCASHTRPLRGEAPDQQLFLLQRGFACDGFSLLLGAACCSAKGGHHCIAFEHHRHDKIAIA